MFKNIFKVKNIIFLISAVLLLIFLSKITGIILLFFSAYIISAALDPYVSKLEKSNVSRSLSTLVVISAAILSILILFIPIFIIAFREIKIFFAFLPQKMEVLSTFIHNFRLNGQGIIDLIDINTLLGNSSNLAQNIFNHSLNFTIGFAQVCVLGIAITMIVFYLLVDKKYITEKFIEFFPPDLKDKSNQILSTITFKVGNYVRAQILSLIAVGIMVMISLVILGIEYPFLLGLISGILDIVPILGPAIALLVILLVTAQHGIVKVVLVTVLFLTVQQLSNYVIKPFLFGKFMKLHPLMIFFSLFVAQQFLGVWGVILSPAIAATICVLIDELYLIPINRGKEIE